MNIRILALTLLTATILAVAPQASATHDDGGKVYIKPHFGNFTQQCPSDEKVDGGTYQRRCFWDAEHMGNGLGRSFILFRGGHLRHISHAQAHRMWITSELTR